ncbi:hypothetical protein [Priestia koreensis]|uniref:hypothetical protein n=1 Tax=Priestia koreensis TaxID=284581 RepID=UPI001F59C092|nr:hypothetical protein [Priestia koreensis]UNL86297.1 hypothetical protein IE339_07315 [Priestia koreensis]
MIESQAEELEKLRFFQREVDLIIAALLLTGQLTMSRVIIEPGGFSLTVSGPIIGRVRLEGKYGNKLGSAVLDGIDIVLAILLLKGDIGFTGLFIAPGGFSFNIGGPIFGGERPVVLIPNYCRVFDEFKQIVSNHFHVDAMLLKNL